MEFFTISPDVVESGIKRAKEIYSDKRSKELDYSTREFYCNQQKIFSLVQLMCSGVSVPEGHELAHKNTPTFIPTLADAKDRGIVTKKILELVNKF